MNDNNEFVFFKHNNQTQKEEIFNITIEETSQSLFNMFSILMKIIRGYIRYEYNLKHGNLEISKDDLHCFITSILNKFLESNFPPNFIHYCELNSFALNIEHSELIKQLKYVLKYRPYFNGIRKSMFAAIMSKREFVGENLRSTKILLLNDLRNKDPKSGYVFVLRDKHLLICYNKIAIKVDSKDEEKLLLFKSEKLESIYIVQSMPDPNTSSFCEMRVRLSVQKFQS